jgi:hypothetical protein
MRSVKLDPLDRAQHRNRWGNRPVAIEQRGADESDQDHCRAPSIALRAPRADERKQRQDAALAVVVGAHDEDGVLERDDDYQRPKDQRHDAEHSFRRHLTIRAGGLGCNVQGVERARADVAEHDPHACERRRRDRTTCSLPGRRMDLRGRTHVERPRLLLKLP